MRPEAQPTNLQRNCSGLANEAESLRKQVESYLSETVEGTKDHIALRRAGLDLMSVTSLLTRVAEGHKA